MRTLDERITVRFPWLYQLVAKPVLRLPLRSWLRRLLLARRTMAGYHAMNRGDLDVLLAIYDPKVVVSFHSGGPMPPDLTGEYHGHDGFRSLWERWLGSWQELRLEPKEVIDAGGAILVTVAVSGRGRASGVATETQLHEVFTFRNGLIARHEDFTEEAAALRAIGIEADTIALA